MHSKIKSTLIKKNRRCNFYICENLLPETAQQRKQKYWGECIANNGKEVWRTSENYHNKADVINAIKIVSPDNIFKRFENWINDN